MGGGEDPAKAQISTDDIARVVQLYSKPHDGSNATTKLAKWSAIPEPIRVESEDASDDPDWIEIEA